MKLVVQKVINASVLIDNKYKESIKEGIVVFIGFKKDDTDKEIDKVTEKLLNLRIFEENGKMNLSVKDLQKEILLISQFTLYANTKKGNRPSFENVMDSKNAENLYNFFVKTLKEKYNKVKTGKFKSDMKVTLVNDGPVTIIM